MAIYRKGIPQGHLNGPAHHRGGQGPVWVSGRYFYAVEVADVRVPGVHDIVSTILPIWVLLSMWAWAAAASVSG